MVMEYTKQESLRKLLDSKYSELNWTSKVANLSYIANGLNTIHKANLMHKDFYSRNIVNQNMHSFYITDFEVFTGYPPYHNIPHDKDLATCICLGYRPKIRCKVPQLLLDLMNKCLDTDPQNRSTAKELGDMLY
ncbi:kinase-like domain-containing protein [Gigaspora rosea]|uniref:Kinase-like domain-containing protein n=1 Tax=Gigaspora rosea TaxID=44941 RepID=A0A397VI74_9GLOM|nr:kinase-like domain-containing protein [Gigaspora rosea]